MKRSATSSGSCTCDSQCLTHGLLYYNEPATLLTHVTNWASWPSEVRQQIEFIVVDDSSDARTAASRVLARSSAKAAGMIVRVLHVLPPKLAWNIGGSRNLLMHLAKCCHVLMCDLDYALPPALASLVVEATVHAATVSTQVAIRFHRSRPSDVLHPGIAVLHRALYWQVGGCDEDFVGHYGNTDKQ